MLTHYLRLSGRRLWRGRLVNFIRMAGLAIGLASGLVIFLLVNYMFTFDRYHPHMERSYWIVTDVKHDHVMQTDAAPRPLADVLRREYPFVESAVRLETFFGRTISVPDGKGRFVKKFGEARNMCFTEPQYLDLFGVEWVNGNAKTALQPPNTIVLSERYARKYFGTTAALGRTLRLDNRADLTVTGIIKDPPSNTQLRYDALVSYATIKSMEGDEALGDWLGLQSMCFVLMRPGSDPAQLTPALQAIRKKYLPAKEAARFAYHVLPLSDLNHERSGMAPRPVLYALIAVGVLLVLAACTNYVNLATTQALQRSREVGVRKVVGSSRWQLVRQFMLETTLLTLAAVVLALVLTELALPFVNQTLADNADMLRPAISVLDLLEPRALLWFTALIAGVILLAGLYPAKVMSGFNPTRALAGRLTARAVGSLTIRQTLIAGQLFLTQLFLMGVLVISAQLRHMEKADWGFQQEQMLSIWMPDKGARPLAKLREEWLRIPGVEAITFASDPPASRYNRPSHFSYHTATEPEGFETRVRAADENYLSAFGLSLIAGRNFNPADTSATEVIVNAELVKQLGVSPAGSVVGKRMRIMDTDRVIVGVVKDFRSESLRSPVLPVTFIHDLSHSSMAIVKLSPGHSPATLKSIEKTWDEILPEQVYRADLLSNLFKNFVKEEVLLAGFIQIFAFIAVVMSCLGLYGLATFMAEARAKEIGVRRILGARTDQVLWIFSREFGQLLIISFLLAGPLGWWLMNGWLQQYAHRIQLGALMLLATLGISMLITLITILQQALKATFANPVRFLRTE